MYIFCNTLVDIYTKIINKNCRENSRTFIFNRIRVRYVHVLLREIIEINIIIFLVYIYYTDIYIILYIEIIIYYSWEKYIN